MHLITTTCPFCQTRYQVNPALRGHRMRCPNSSCREVFEVHELKSPEPPEVEQERTGHEPRTPPPQPPAGEEIITPVLLEEPTPAPAFLPGEKPPPTSVPVQEMVPLLPAEVAETGKTEPAREAPWRQAPPPVRQPSSPEEQRHGTSPAPVASPRPASPVRRSNRLDSTIPTSRPFAPPPSRDSQPDQALPFPVGETAAPSEASPRGKTEPPSVVPVELPPGTWEPPPIRRRGATNEGPAPDDQHPGGGVSPSSRKPSPSESIATASETRKRRAGCLMGALLLGVALILATVGLGVWYLVQQSEASLLQQARDLETQEQYNLAAEKYRRLVEGYPDSAQVDDYRFHQDLNEVLSLGNSSDTAGALDRLSPFLTGRKGDPRLRQNGKVLAEALFTQLLGLAETVKTNPQDVEAAGLLQRGKQLLTELDRLNRAWIPSKERQRLADLEGAIEQRREAERHRLAVLQLLRDLAASPSAKAVKQMRGLLAEEAAQAGRLDQDPEVLALTSQVYAGHLASVKYIPEAAPPRTSPRANDLGPGLLVLPLISRPGSEPAGEHVVLALARGVLYGLRQSDGEALWARRVGIDTTSLPIRVPASAGLPELALVLSADTSTLTAVNLRSGDSLWTYLLASPCLGRPLILEHRAYVPTVDGLVHEIELAEGVLLGRYHLGQRLSVGGARLEGTRLLFFPADDFCVYALDAAARRCQAILYSEHSGRLRSEPLLLASEDPHGGGMPDAAGAGYLVLSQANGLDAMLLRTYRLLLPGPRIEPVAMPEPRLHGWSSFPPGRDAEKLVLLSDAGELGLFGIVQAQNQDNPLFPLLRQGGPLPGVVDLRGKDQARGRSQVVFTLENDLWLLAGGQLRRYQLTFHRQSGPRLLPHPLWSLPLALGSPLHESQVDDSGTVLFVVTQSLTQQTCLASAVDIETGRIRWQRQLGMLCQGQPLLLGSQVVALDQGGGLFAFDPGKHPRNLEAQWQSGGLVLAPPLSSSAAESFTLLPAADGRSAYEIACPDPGRQVIIRHHVAGQHSVQEQAIDVPARLAGTPALGATALLLPLADGSLLRLALPLTDGATLAAPDWRAGTIQAKQRGHAVWLEGNDFLTSNGQRGLTRWHFEGNIWRSLPDGRDARSPTLELPQRIVAPPVCLPRPNPASPLQVCIADAAGTVHLLQGDELKPIRTWELKGQISAGPFLRQGKILCVVDARRLVALDPAQPRPAWQYDSPGGRIVGHPDLVEGLLIVADLSNRFVALDPATGQPCNAGHVLQGSVAPAVSPVSFGPGRLFAPLTDGTVLLLSLDDLRRKGR